MQRIQSLALVLGCLLIFGCGGSPASPDETGEIVLSGTYSGNASDNTGSGKMSWKLSQSGKDVTGSMTTSSTSGSTIFKGDLLGTLDGSTLDFEIDVPYGGVSGNPGCTVFISGIAKDVTSTHISGTYSGQTSCGSSFSGQFSLSK